jgi:hypothetical protein
MQNITISHSNGKQNNYKKPTHSKNQNRKGTA